MESKYTHRYKQVYAWFKIIAWLNLWLNLSVLMGVSKLDRCLVRESIIRLLGEILLWWDKGTFFSKDHIIIETIVLTPKCYFETYFELNFENVFDNNILVSKQTKKALGLSFRKKRPILQTQEQIKKKGEHFQLCVAQTLIGAKVER